VEAARFLDGEFDDFLGPWRLRPLSRGDHVRPCLHDLLDLQANLAQIDVEVLDHVGSDAGAFFDQPQQDVLGADVFVMEALCLLIGKLHDLARSIGETLVHGRPFAAMSRSTDISVCACAYLSRSGAEMEIKARWPRSSYASTTASEHRLII